MRVVMLGPSDPASLANWLDGASGDRSLAIPGLGGTPVTQLTNDLLRMGIEVDLITLSRGINTIERLKGDGLNVWVGPYRESARARARDLFAQERHALRVGLEESSGDVVHAHWTYEFALAAEHACAPVLVTAHDAPLTILRNMPDRYRLIRTLMAVRARLRIHRLSAVSPYLRDRWRREMLYFKPVRVIPNVVKPLHPTVTRTTSPGTGFRILDVADGGRIKNTQILLKAFAHARDLVPNMSLTLVGTGLDAESAIAKRAHAAGLANGVRFLGVLSRQELGVELSRCDAFVHPSLEETMGMSIAEAMWASLPIIAGARSGGVPWLLDRGNAGRLVDVTSESALISAIIELAKNPELRCRLGAAAHDRAKELLDPTVVTMSYIDEYREMIRVSRP